MRFYRKEEIRKNALQLPDERYKQEILKIVEFGGNPFVVAEVLILPEIIGKEYNLTVLKDIFLTLSTKKLRVLNKIGKALVFYEKDEKVGSIMRRNAKEILIYLGEEYSKVNKIFDVMCMRMFINTGEEPFEIIEEIAGKKVKYFYKLLPYLSKRLDAEKNIEEKGVLSKRMLEMILRIFEKNKGNDSSVKEIVRPLIYNVTKEELFKEALVEIGKRSGIAMMWIKTWKDRDGVDRSDALRKIEKEVENATATLKYSDEKIFDRSFKPPTKRSQRPLTLDSFQTRKQTQKR